MIGARATKRRMVHGKSSEAEVCPAQERKTFLNRYKQRSDEIMMKSCNSFIPHWGKPHVRNELKMYFFFRSSHPNCIFFCRVQPVNSRYAPIASRRLRRLEALSASLEKRRWWRHFTAAALIPIPAESTPHIHYFF